jgi:WD40 repeat protein
MTWKMWTVPGGELVMSGDGHREWIAGVEFHPHGTHLATCSGDGLVKLWDFATVSCAATFSDHTQATWDIAFHHTGDFLVSCSMDHTCKLWDLNR